jgi:hypothetical protein
MASFLPVAITINLQETNNQKVMVTSPCTKATKKNPKDVLAFTRHAFRSQEDFHVTYVKTFGKHL